MDSYNLEPGEVIILQEDSVEILSDTDEESLEEIVLTNRNLILVDEVWAGLFKKTRLLKRCPLAKINLSRGIPQTVAAKIEGVYHLQVSFEDETIILKFPSNPRGLSERWANAIRQAALGDLDAARKGTELSTGVSDLVEEAKGLVGSLFSGAKDGGKPARPLNPVAVTKHCVGCHAPLTGNAGETVTCEYCDTRQTL